MQYENLMQFCNAHKNRISGTDTVEVRLLSIILKRLARSVKDSQKLVKQALYLIDKNSGATAPSVSKKLRETKPGVSVANGMPIFYRLYVIEPFADDIIALSNYLNGDTRAIDEYYSKKNKSIDVHEAPVLALVKQRLKGYFPNPVTRLFLNFIDENEYGTWLLTSGPGDGKTTIMASLYRELRSKYSCVGYFLSMKARTYAISAKTFIFS